MLLNRTTYLHRDSTLSELHKLYVAEAETRVSENGKKTYYKNGLRILGRNTFYSIAKAITSPTVAKAGVSYYQVRINRALDIFDDLVARVPEVAALARLNRIISDSTPPLKGLDELKTISAEARQGATKHFYAHATSPGACDGDYVHCAAAGVGHCGKEHSLSCSGCVAVF